VIDCIHAAVAGELRGGCGHGMSWLGSAELPAAEQARFDKATTLRLSRAFVCVLAHPISCVKELNFAGLSSTHSTLRSGAELAVSNNAAPVTTSVRSVSPQFHHARWAGDRVWQVQRLEAVEHDLRHHQTRVVLAVSGHHVPRRIIGARRTQAGLTGGHVLGPELAFFCGSSMRWMNRLRCSSGDRCRKNLTMRMPLTCRWRSRSTMERQRPSLGGAVFPGRIHRLQDQQHRLAVGGVEQLLQVAQMFHLLLLAIGIVLF